MTLTIETFIEKLEAKVPLSLSIPSDNNGLKIGNPNAALHKIVGTLELTAEVVEYAIEQNIDLICLHHDPLYVPLKYIRTDVKHTELIMKLISHNIAVYVAHTNLDAVTGGVNEMMYQLLLGETPKILDPSSHIGRYGSLKKPMVLSDYLKDIIKPKQNTARIIATDSTKMISKIAVVSGSGSDFYQLAKNAHVDLFITGDIDYHTAMSAQEDEFAVLDIGHDYERIVEKVWSQLFWAIKKENDYDFSISDKEFTFIPWKNV